MMMMLKVILFHPFGRNLPKRYFPKYFCILIISTFSFSLTFWEEEPVELEDLYTSFDFTTNSTWRIFFFKSWKNKDLLEH